MPRPADQGTKAAHGFNTRNSLLPSGLLHCRPLTAHFVALPLLHRRARRISQASRTPAGRPNCSPSASPARAAWSTRRLCAARSTSGYVLWYAWLRLQGTGACSPSHRVTASLLGPRRQPSLSYHWLAPIFGVGPAVQGALAFRGWNGMFSKHLSLEFWLYVGYPGWEGQNQQTPDLWVSISGKKVRAPVTLLHRIVVCVSTVMGVRALGDVGSTKGSGSA